MYGGACFDAKEEPPVDDKDEAAKISCSRRKKSKPTRMWITTLADYVSDYEQLEPEETIHCVNHEEMVAKTMEAVKAVDPQAFFKEFGDGYHYGFNRYDGDIGHGYLMQWRPNGGWNLLHISMVHAYYGK